MPRSTGGGSHSSGSHSSSFHSSGGSHSSGYSSSHSSSYSSSSSYHSSSSSRSSFSSSSYAGASHPPRRPARSNTDVFVSKRHFAGAQRYVYYRNDKPHYIYSNYETIQREKHPGRLVFYVCLVILMIIAYYQIYTTPAHLDNTGDTRIVIRDSIGVIKDQDALCEALQSFLDTTGVTPAVMTMTNESWNSHYTSLEAKTFDLYVNTFDDEQHWLIVYSQPETPDADFVDWLWEGVAGDDTAVVLTNELTDQFGSRLQKYLTIEKISVGEAIRQAFDEITPLAAVSTGHDASDVMGAVLVVLGTIVLGYFRSGYRFGRNNRPKELPADAVPVKDLPESAAASKPSETEVVCAYCGSVLSKKLLTCPHCGAARSPRR